MGGLIQEFKDFLIKQNAMALELCVIILCATGKVVSGSVDDVIMPIIGVALPGGEWREAQFSLTAHNAIKYGDLIGRLIDFVIIAAVVFAIVKAIVRPAAPAPTKTCPFCKES